MIKLNERLLKSRKSARYTQKILCNQLDIAEQTVIKYEKGTRIPNADILERWAEITQCDPTWLLTGQGEMVQTERTQNSVGEDMSNYERMIADIEEDGTPEQLVELEQALGKIGRVHRGLRSKLRNLPKKA